MPGSASTPPGYRRQNATLERKHNVNDIKHRIDNMPPKQTEIGDRLKAAREKLNLSQDDAAKAWKLSAATLRKWEQGQREPRGLYLREVETILKRAGV